MCAVLQVVTNSRIPGPGTCLTCLSFLLLPCSALGQPSHFSKLQFPPQPEEDGAFSGKVEIGKKVCEEAESVSGT